LKAKTTKAAAPQAAQALVSLTVPMPAPGMSEGAQALLAQAEALKVVTADDYALAGAGLLALNTRARELEAQRKELKGPIDLAAARVQALFNPPLQVLASAKAIINKKMGMWAQQQDTLRRDEQRRADEKARKEQDRLNEQARRAVESGKVEKAVQLEQRASAVVAPTVSREPPKIAGVSLRESWNFEITNPALLPREYLMADETRIRGVVKSMKADCVIPGVRVWCDMVPASGAG
jgi:hypothetical protein